MGAGDPERLAEPARSGRQQARVVDAAPGSHGVEARRRLDGPDQHRGPVADLAAGEVGGFAVAGTTVLACRLGDRLFAYRDRCGACGESMAGAALHRRMGSGADDAVLRCPRCHAHFDVVRAGACVDGNGSAGTHLEPVPLLERDGVLSMAIAAAVAS